MPDLLAHAFLAYSLLRALSWRYEWITPPLVTAGMAGAFIPDIVKVKLVLPSATVEAFLGVPFAWDPIHQFGGTLICVLIGGALVTHRVRRSVLLVLALGAASHLMADALLLKVSGRSYAILWPLTQWRPPTPGLYLSTQPEPTIVTAALAVAVWGLSRRLDRSTSGDSA